MGASEQMVNNGHDEFQRAYAAALRLLGLCDRSKKDLRERLSKKGYSAEVVERVLSQLESMGYVDDERFALKFAMDAVKRKNAGPEAIRYGLQQKGIQKEIIDGTVSKVFQDIDEKTVARRALSKKLELRGRGVAAGFSLRSRSAARNDEIKRLSDYLRRKGFSYDIIKAAIREIKEEDDI